MTVKKYKTAGNMKVRQHINCDGYGPWVKWMLMGDGPENIYFLISNPLTKQNLLICQKIYIQEKKNKRNMKK